VDGGEGVSVTRTTSTQAKKTAAEIEKDQIDLIITTIETVCQILLALIKILKGLR